MRSNRIHTASIEAVNWNRFIQCFTCIVLSVMCSYVAQSQDIKACFTTRDTLGCVPYTVKLDECTGGAQGIRYKYGNGDYTRSDTFTFKEPGEYTITQLTENISGNGDNLLVKARYIKVVRSVAPTFEVLLCDGKQVNVKISDTQFPVYIIDFGDGQTLQSTPNSDNFHTYTDVDPKIVSVTGQFLSGVCPTAAAQNITPVENLSFERFFSVSNNVPSNTYDFSINLDKTLSYSFLSASGREVHEFVSQEGVGAFTIDNARDSCYYFKVTDACNSDYTSLPICLNPFTTELTDTSVRVSWVRGNASNLKEYRLYRDGDLLGTISDVQISSYEDLTVQCGKSYCYSLETILLDSTTFISRHCVVAASNKIPDPPTSIKSTFSDDNILKVVWSVPKNNSFKNATLSTNNQTVLSTRDTIFQSKDYSTSCYVLSYSDSCDKASAQTDICPIILNVSNRGRGIYEASWNTYSPFSGSITYDLYENGIIIYSGASTGFVTSETDTINQIKVYKVIANFSNGSSQSNTVNLEQDMKVFFPTAFSPNGDGLNDHFTPKTRFVKSYRIGIYNIWGQVVFTSTDPSKPWDGDGCQNNTYSYVAEAEDFLGNSKVYRGNVVIVR